MSVSIIQHGKSRRLRSIKQIVHHPTLRGTGKWHSRRSLWAYKRKARRKRLIAAASRRANRV